VLAAAISARMPIDCGHFLQSCADQRL
jgi:hypothetical protein